MEYSFIRDSGESKCELGKHNKESVSARNKGGSNVTQSVPSVKSLKSFLGSRNKDKKRDIKLSNASLIQCDDPMRVQVKKKSHFKKKTPYDISQILYDGDNEERISANMVEVNKAREKKKPKSIWLLNLHKRRKASKEKTNSFRYRPEIQIASHFQDQTFSQQKNHSQHPLLKKQQMKPDWQSPSNTAAIYSGSQPLSRADFNFQAEDAIRSFESAMSSAIGSPPNNLNIETATEELNKVQMSQVSPEYVIQLIDKVLSEGFKLKD